MNEDFDQEAAAKARFDDLIYEAGTVANPQIDLYRSGPNPRKWGLAEFAIDLFVNEITERDVQSWIANINDEAELGRLVARELRYVLETIVNEEDQHGLSLVDRDDIDRSATAADLAWEMEKTARREAA